MNELGFYTLAGAPRSPRDLIDEVQSGRGARHRRVFHFRAIQHQRGGDAVGRGRRRVEPDRHRDRRDEPEHAASARHCGIRDDDAFPDRRPVCAGSRTRHRRDVRCVRAAAHHDRAVGRLCQLMRRLWHGETVVGHKGPAGSWPVLRLDPAFREDIPLMLTAFGPQSLALGGRAYDGVVLHTFFTDETTARCVQTIKQAAEDRRARSGRRARLVVFCDDRRSSAAPGAAEENRWADGHLSAGLRRPDGQDESLGSGGADALQAASAGREVPGRHRPARDDRGARTDRRVDSAGVARARRDRQPGAMRRENRGPIRARLRRRHSARCGAGGARADRRGVSSAAQAGRGSIICRQTPPRWRDADGRARVVRVWTRTNF